MITGLSQAYPGGWGYSNESKRKPIRVETDSVRGNYLIIDKEEGITIRAYNGKNELQEEIKYPINLIKRQNA